MASKPKAAKIKPPRLPSIDDGKLTPRQKELLDSIRSSRGKATQGGPFGVYLHAPEFGDLTQKLGAHCRYKTAIEPRLSEFTILCTARFWRAHYEWYAHAPIAEKAGVKSAAIAELKAGRVPKSARKDERAIFDFIQELYKTRRVSDRNYKRVHALFGDSGMVEFVGILGYYGLVAMTLDVFRVPLPDGEKLPFAEPK